MWEYLIQFDVDETQTLVTFALCKTEIRLT